MSIQSGNVGPVFQLDSS